MKRSVEISLERMEIHNGESTLKLLLAFQGSFIRFVKLLKRKKCAYADIDSLCPSYRSDDVVALAQGPRYLERLAMQENHLILTQQLSIAWLEAHRWLTVAMRGAVHAPIRAC